MTPRNQSYKMVFIMHSLRVKKKSIISVRSRNFRAVACAAYLVRGRYTFILTLFRVENSRPHVGLAIYGGQL